MYWLQEQILCRRHHTPHFYVCNGCTVAYTKEILKVWIWHSHLFPTYFEFAAKDSRLLVTFAVQAHFVQWHAPNAVLSCWYDTSPEHKIVSQPSSFLQAEWTPMLADCTSASIPPQPSQLAHKRTRGLLQSPGGLSDALISGGWSCLWSERASWPKKRSRLVLIRKNKRA